MEIGNTEAMPAAAVMTAAATNLATDRGKREVDYGDSKHLKGAGRRDEPDPLAPRTQHAPQISAHGIEPGNSCHERTWTIQPRERKQRRSKEHAKRSEREEDASDDNLECARHWFQGAGRDQRGGLFLLRRRLQMFDDPKP